MKSLRSILACALAVSLAGLPACADIEDPDVDYADEVEGSDDSKSDQADIAVTKVDVANAPNGGAAGVGVVKSKAAFKSVFGFTAPSTINFQREWVAFYSAGEQTSGGYAADITRVRLSDTGKTLKVSARLDVPGADCAVTAALTTPYTVVKFKKPLTAPTTNRYSKEERTVSCSDESCANGSMVNEDHFFPSTDGMQCHQQKEHCVTNDNFACPQISPLPPSFCPNGTVVAGPRRFVSSADGMECSMPSVHCVTNDSSACPQIHPLPPTFCAAGTVVPGARRFVPSADGMECSMPSVHCVTSNASACPF